MNLKGIIFDLDGTLVDTLPVCVGAHIETSARFTGRRPSDAEVLSHFGPSEEGSLEKLVPGRLSETLPVFLKFYEELHSSVQQPFTGIEQTLQWLRARQMPVAIVTGKGKFSAEISLRILGLERWVDCVEVGFADRADKPYSIRKVLDRWQMRPEEAAYVGDMPYDMQAARETGLLPIGAGWAETSLVRDGNAGAVHTFLSVDEFLAWLESQGSINENAQKGKSVV